jgi:hypothetical protein
VADATAGGAVTTSVRVLAVAGALQAASGLLPLDVDVGRYLAAASSGAVGTVLGQAFQEGRRPGDSPSPVSDVAVRLVPYSDALVARLEHIRRGARADARSYRTSARALQAARRALERALSDAGAGELVRFTAVSPDGMFELERVPAGRWLLIAERAVFVPRAAPPPGKQERQMFAPAPRLRGYYAVTVWLRDFSLEEGGAEMVQLTDRNAWMTAIEEEREPGGGS